MISANDLFFLFANSCNSYNPGSYKLVPLDQQSAATQQIFGRFHQLIKVKSIVHCYFCLLHLQALSLA